MQTATQFHVTCFVLSVSRSKKQAYPSPDALSLTITTFLSTYQRYLFLLHILSIYLCLCIGKATSVVILTPRLFFNQVSSFAINAIGLVVTTNCGKITQLLVFLSFFNLKTSYSIESLQHCCYIRKLIVAITVVCAAQAGES
jgi:hypothetical protein